MPSFYSIYSTEVNIDAYALLNMLYQETHEKKYKDSLDKILVWMRKNAFNKKEHRFNRGYKDRIIASDVHSWGISALGVDTLDSFEQDLAEQIIYFLERHCVVEIEWIKKNGYKINVRGVDFTDRQRVLAELKRNSLISPEWTFQLINAYRRLENDFIGKGEHQKAEIYRKKHEDLLKNIMQLAVENNGMLAFPYASHPNAVIGHEYKTPQEGNLSAIGVAYAILSLTGYDPLYFKNFSKK